MSVVKELIRTDQDGTISFGNYELTKKTKLTDYEFKGDLYKIKTYNEITRLEKNDNLLYESVPGTAVTELDVNDTKVSYKISGNGNVSVTMGMQDDTEYRVVIDGVVAGHIKTSMGGKLSFSVELTEGKEAAVEIDVVG
ncbi:MAG TPA: endosialidase [Lachnospiraceae bacterium]|nr:endosialidase [Lachnospiraceae bacterium]